MSKNEVKTKICESCRTEAVIRTSVCQVCGAEFKMSQSKKLLIGLGGALVILAVINSASKRRKNK